MVGAFDLFAVEGSAGKRHAAMGAGVAQSEGLAVAIASDDQRLFEQRRLRKLRSMDLTCRERAVPETEEHERVGCLPPQRAKVGPAGGRGLGLEWKVVGHGNK
jgi:hypothetical protein